LPKELVEEKYDVSVRIPMLPTLRCLNLSNSVAVAVYEVLRQWNFSGME
jgi:tRNA (cytidine/uridine-2'-O-)-methyltransferase